MQRFVLFVLLLLAAFPGVAQQTANEWTIVDYSALVDRRELTHSGEPVGILLDRLAGRPVPPPGQRPADLNYHRLLEPLLERYAYVVSDVLDGVEGIAPRPLLELGALWHPGEAQPAWAELLRARHIIVESDGQGTLRVALPLGADQDPRQRPSAQAAQQAWERSWSLMRHVIAAEQRRLQKGDALPKIKVRVFPFVHLRARSIFLIGLQPYGLEVENSAPRGDRPPL